MTYAAWIWGLTARQDLADVFHILLNGPLPDLCVAPATYTARGGILLSIKLPSAGVIAWNWTRVVVLWSSVLLDTNGAAKLGGRRFLSFLLQLCFISPTPLCASTIPWFFTHRCHVHPLHSPPSRGL